MEDSFWVAMVLVCVVIIEGVKSWREGTFYFNQTSGKEIKLPFIMHWGVVIGDLILIPLAVSLGWLFMECSLSALFIFFVVAFLLTLVCHFAWWFMCAKQRGFMYPDRNGSWGVSDYWYKDLPVSAWIHFVYMILAVMYLQAYIFSPMPSDVVWKTCWIFLVFVPLGVIEPGIVQGWPPTKKDIITSVGTAIVLWIIVGGVTWIKLTHVFGL